MIDNRTGHGATQTGRGRGSNWGKDGETGGEIWEEGENEGGRVSWVCVGGWRLGGNDWRHMLALEQDRVRQRGGRRRKERGGR